MSILSCFLKGFFTFWSHCKACGPLVPWPGIEPVPPVVEMWSFNHWTAGKSLLQYFYSFFFFFYMEIFFFDMEICDQHKFYFAMEFQVDRD